MFSKVRRAPDEFGMSTAEYAIGTVAACGFACVLLALVPTWRTLIMNTLLHLLSSRLGLGPFGFLL